MSKKKEDERISRARKVIQEIYYGLKKANIFMPSNSKKS